MRIALAGPRYDFFDPLSWSGIPVSIREALERRGDVETVVLGPLPPPSRAPEAARKAWHRLRGETYFWDREPRVVRHWAGQLDRLVDAYRPDAVIAIGGVTVAALPTSVRPVLYGDATWHANVDYYDTWTGMARRTREQGERTEQLGFDRETSAQDLGSRILRDSSRALGAPR